MWNAISSGLQAVQDKLDNVIDDVTSSHDTSLSEVSKTDSTESHPPPVGVADTSNEDVCTHKCPHMCDMQTGHLLYYGYAAHA